jgi:hypothetical protein
VRAKKDAEDAARKIIADDAMRQAAKGATVKKAAEDAARELASAKAALRKVSYIILFPFMHCNRKGGLRSLWI